MLIEEVEKKSAPPASAFVQERNKLEKKWFTIFTHKLCDFLSAVEHKMRTLKTDPAHAGQYNENEYKITIKKHHKKGLI